MSLQSGPSQEVFNVRDSDSYTLQNGHVDNCDEPSVGVSQTDGIARLRYQLTSKGTR